ncbi:hypothetical protein [Pelagerythrobacter aerophilus]|nr:hypothetical protein [Pelagerythrobacter aerophilus]
MSPIFITAFVAIAAVFLALALAVSEWLVRRGRRRGDGDDTSATL